MPFLTGATRRFRNRENTTAPGAHRRNSAMPCHQDINAEGKWMDMQQEARCMMNTVGLPGTVQNRPEAASRAGCTVQDAPNRLNASSSGTERQPGLAPRRKAK